MIRYILLIFDRLKYLTFPNLLENENPFNLIL